METVTVRNKNVLIAAIQSGATPSYLFFWGHRPSKTGCITPSCFSQWFESPFTVDNEVYPTAEHFMMAKKAELFRDMRTRQAIIQAKGPDKAKSLGRIVTNFDESIWVKNRWHIVVEGNLHKFTQHPRLGHFLLNTSEQILVEASPVDIIWGIGLKADSPWARHPEKWPGLNLLGFALMEVRSQLLEQKK